MILLLKLITGEEVIGETDIGVDVDGSVTLHIPMALARHPEKGLVIMKYAPFARDKYVKFPRDGIMHVLTPVNALEDNYIQSTQEPSRIIAPSTNIIV